MYRRDGGDEDTSFSVQGNVLKNVEIFRTGVFRGTLFEKDYIGQMIENFKKLKKSGVFTNVPVRADHPDPFGVKNRMEGVVGFITNVREKANGDIDVMEVVDVDEDGKEKREKKTIEDVRLVADFEITEPKALKKIKRRTYRDRSIEFGAFPDNNGNVHEPVLAGVAFVDIPQVDQLQSLFSKLDNGDMDVALFDKDLDISGLESDKDAVDEDTKKKDDSDDNEVKSDKAVEEDKDEKTTTAVEDEDKGEADENKGEADKADETAEDDSKDGDEDGKGGEEDKVTTSTDEEEDEVEEGSKSDGDTKTLDKTMEINELRKFKLETLMKDKLSLVEAFMKTGHSTPAMSKLEAALVNAFFAEKGSESYLSPDGMFNLFKQIKSSTPKVWEKKDELKAVSDKETISKLRKKVEGGSEGDADAADYITDAKRRVKAAGL